jgi:GMP synthase-like glutamine amidotransferase
MTLGSLARHPTVLIVLHQELSTPVRVGVAVKAMDVRLDVRRPSCGEPLPDTLADHDGVVVFGGPMGSRASCFWVYAYPAFLRYAAHSVGGYWARISPQAWQMAS